MGTTAKIEDFFEPGDPRLSINGTPVLKDEYPEESPDQQRRRRLSEAMKASWAKRRAGNATAVKPPNPVETEALRGRAEKMRAYRAPAKKLAGETLQLNVTIDQGLAERIDQYIESLAEDLPGLVITRAQAARMLLHRALENKR